MEFINIYTHFLFIPFFVLVLLYTLSFLLVIVLLSLIVVSFVYEIMDYFGVCLALGTVVHRFDVRGWENAVAGYGVRVRK